MKKVVIIGHSPAAKSIIDTLYSSDEQFQITIICCDQRLPYDRSRLVELLSKEAKASDLVLEDETYYTKRNVDVVVDETITRINVNRRKIHTSSKKQFDFDILYLLDTTTVNPPSIKGHRKEGLFCFDRISHLQAIIDYMPFVDTVAVQADSLQALKMALTVNGYGKEVILVFTQDRLFDWLDSESAKILTQILEAKNMRIVSGDIISEAIGESSIKAVRLVSGKVMAAEMILFERSVPDLKICADTDLVFDEFIPVSDQTLQTNVDGVFAADYVACLKEGTLPLSYDGLVEQGRFLGASLVSQQDPFSFDEQPNNTLRSKGLFVQSVGTPYLSEGGSEFSRFDNASDEYIKVFAQDSIVTGAIFINASQEQQDKINKLILDQIEISGVEDYMLEQNFSLDDMQRMKTQAAEPVQE